MSTLSTHQLRSIEQVIHDYRQWKLARLAFKKSLQRAGQKGPIVRRALSKLEYAKSVLRKSIDTARDAKRISCEEVSGVAS